MSGFCIHLSLRWVQTSKVRSAGGCLDSNSAQMWVFPLKWGMPVKVDAVYENGVLRPLQPLDLKEHERVVLSVAKSVPESAGSALDVEFVEKIKAELRGQVAPGLNEVRARLAKIPGSMAEEIIAERGDR